MLARREYGRAELRARLLTRGVGTSDVDGVLDELTSLGFLSDARFAQALVTSRTGRYSKRAIAHELKHKHVDDEASAAALAALAPVDEIEEALALWRRRFDAAPRDDRERARQVRFLLSRGYSQSIAFKVLRAAQAGTPDSSE